MSSTTVTGLKTINDIGNIQDGDYVVGNRGAGNTGTITFNGVVYDADFTTNGLMARTAAGAYANRTITGTSNRVSITNGDAVSGDPTIDISASYVGQNSITTLGTVTTGTWAGSTVSVLYGGSGVTTSTGTTNNVLSNGPTLVAPLLGTPASGNLSNCTNYPIASVSNLGTGVATFLTTPSSANLISAVTDETGTGALVFANTPTLVTPLLGTPTSGSLANCNGYPLANLTGAGAGALAFLATPSSANLRTLVTDETGTGALVFASTPTLVTPVLGAATATSVDFGTSATDGIKGVTSGSSAAAGVVGEVISSTVSAVAIANNTFVNVTSITLTAGEWVVFGGVKSNPAGGTTQTQVATGISQTSVTLPTIYSSVYGAIAAGVGVGVAAQQEFYRVTGSTTVHLVGYVLYAVSTLTIDGKIFARRVR